MDELEREQFKRKEKTVPVPLKENLYSRVNLSVKTMDGIIGILTVLLIVCFIFVIFGM